MSAARYIMVGGFLGAGKTTAILQFARHLRDRGLRVGLITNDQGSELVDTAMLASHGFPVEEIAGGCFCCRFDSLVEAAKKLNAGTRPDLFIAEPVGSCTDLVATVSYPLRRIYGDSFAMAPLSVLIDPVRARRVLGLADGARFSDKVLYIYRKQLEEADLIVINKRDLLQADQLAALRASLAAGFPRAEILDASARHGDGLEAWFSRVLGSTPSAGAAMSMDYAVYGEGEALLGWLNATVRLSAPASFDGNAFLERLADDILRRLARRGAEIAHLKMTLDPEGGLGDLAVVNVVRNDLLPELSQELQDTLESGRVIINLRAEAPPESLRSAVTEAIAGCGRAVPGLAAELEHLEFFQPGQPRPTHRIEKL
jgi:Ni2+-binding GTPase involved in maturation of urease and hydrogenase